MSDMKYGKTYCVFILTSANPIKKYTSDMLNIFFPYVTTLHTWNGGLGRPASDQHWVNISFLLAEVWKSAMMWKQSARCDFLLYFYTWDQSKFFVALNKVCEAKMRSRPMGYICWCSSVVDGGPTLNQRWINVSFCRGIRHRNNSQPYGTYI